MAEDIKPSTWRELRDFANLIPDEHLDNDVAVDYSETTLRVKAEITPSDLWINKEDYEDVYDSEKDFLEAVKNGDAEEKYFFKQPKGTPFLTTEF